MHNSETTLFVYIIIIKDYITGVKTLSVCKNIIHSLSKLGKNLLQTEVCLYIYIDLWKHASQSLYKKQRGYENGAMSDKHVPVTWGR